jgi:hypothetical protein
VTLLDAVLYIALVPSLRLGFVFLGGLLLFLFGRTRHQVGRWAERLLTLGRRRK